MESKPTVLVTNVEYQKAKHAFVETPDLDCVCAGDDEAALVAAVREHGACSVIVGVEPYLTDALYEAIPEGGVVARFGVGHESVDKARATAHKILVTNTPGALTVTVAEHAIWLMGALARHVAPVHAEVCAGTWQPRVGTELRGKTLAIIGPGAIGREVAGIAARGLGMNAVAFGRRMLPEPECRASGISLMTTSFEEAAREAHFISLHLASTPETRHFINAERIAAMHEGAYLINTARGAVLDELALFDALASHRLAGAALDVFETEPYVPAAPDRDLRALPNVLLTPHTGSTTLEACTRMAERALANVRAGLAKRYDEMDILNPEALAATG